jgi:DNA-binding transcriptional LysR family regulator
MWPILCEFLCDERNNVELTVDNTELLLAQLDKGELDFALIEGYFNKNKYDYTLMKNESFTGICSTESDIAGREMEFSELFDRTLILRERGSGTRDILKNTLRNVGCSVENFKRVICTNNFGVIRELVAKDIGISFAYKSIADADKRLAPFFINNERIVHEFNYVYLKNTAAKEKLRDFIGHNAMD